MQILSVLKQLVMNTGMIMEEVRILCLLQYNLVFLMKIKT